ncbi:hypothetical protein KL86APRO_12626 [uncultured Alphaproteobacteria bacterium]|uniref:Uncharacterized protein n=1 Tax=uncultured Alphaproteobacteria bacterium TaxID=91750 RepID=A0A212KD93_9PROT|nr:hypothetical protein KL86APRO_12626 [uncultured Alphaproteobacteria bacterium]
MQSALVGRHVCAVLEGVGEDIGIFSSQQTLFRQQMVTEIAADRGNETPLRRENDASVFNHDRSRLLLFGQADVNETILVHIFFREDVLELVASDAAAALIEFFKNVERQGPVDHRWHGDGEGISGKKPDRGQLEFFETIQGGEIGYSKQNSRRKCGCDERIEYRRIENDIHIKKFYMNNVYRYERNDKETRNSK